MADSKRVRQLGDIRVTALDDGFDDLPITVVVNIDEAGAAALAELSPGNDLLHPVFNAYLVETGGRRLLIDAGGGVHMGPNAGKMLGTSRKPGSRPAMSTRSSSPIATLTTFSALSTGTGTQSSRMPSWWCRNSMNSSGCAAILRRSKTNTSGWKWDGRKGPLLPIAGGRANRRR